MSWIRRSVRRTLTLLLMGPSVVALLSASAAGQGDAYDAKSGLSLLEVVNAAEKPWQLQLCAKIDDATAELILKYRNAQGPAGYESSDKLQADILTIDPSGETLKKLCACYACCGIAPSSVGQWTTLPYQTQSPSGGYWPSAHASLLPTGKVLFFPEFDSTDTLIWDPTNFVTPLFSYPDNLPNNWLWCSHHVFLPTGELMAVGGGGNAIAGALDTAWRFDPFGGPNGKGWWTQAASMANRRWYPTAVNLGEGLVFVASGYDPNVVSNVECEITTSSPTRGQRSPVRRGTRVERIARSPRRTQASTSCRRERSSSRALAGTTTTRQARPRGTSSSRRRRRASGST
jgi:hypothetical protein